MKVARMPSVDGPDWWVVLHDLGVAEGRFRQFRPIHALTFLAQHKAQPNGQQAFSLGMALENKLFGSRYFVARLQEAVTPTSEAVYQGHYVTDYGVQQRAIAALEAYLASIYSVLEIAAHLNKIFHPALPRGFRRQSKKFAAFSFAQWDWLPHFLDLRTELTHFNTPLPSIKEQKVVVEFTNPSELEIFQKGRFEIPFDVICAYVPHMFDMLDAWAVSELESIDPEAVVNILFEQGWKKPLKSQEVKVREILDQVAGA